MGIDFWNREELYSAVWESPLIKVAPKYGVSAVGLGKVCRKLQVPLPGRGYWAKKEFGKPSERIPLPKEKDIRPVMRMSAAPAALKQNPEPERNPNDPEVIRITEVESQRWTVEPDAKRHRLVTLATRVLRKGHTDNRAILFPHHGESCLDVRVSKNTFDRAMLIINSIVNALEGLGYPVGVQTGAEGTAAEIFSERVPFSIGEKSRVKPKQETQPNSWRATEYELTGELEFRIGGYSTGFKKRWRDSKTKKLESVLNLCLGALLREGRYRRIQSEIRQREMLERERKQKELAELSVLIQEEEKKLRDLESWVSSWNEADIMRRFILALEKVWANEGHDLSPESPKGQRILWMKQQADRRDPMIPNPPSVLDRKSELNRWW